jgi:hypothetical protein
MFKGKKERARPCSAALAPFLRLTSIPASDLRPAGVSSVGDAHRSEASADGHGPPDVLQTLLKLEADGERHGLTRLGAAYALLGEWERAAAVLAPVYKLCAAKL